MTQAERIITGRLPLLAIIQTKDGARRADVSVERETAANRTG